MGIKKLATFEFAGYPQWGVLTEDETGIYSAFSLEESFFIPLPETLLEFVRLGNDGLLALASAWEQNETTKAVSPIALDTVQILAPFPEVERNIFCVGKNYSDHIDELKDLAPQLAPQPTHPVIFTKAATSVIGTNEVIQSHKGITKELDYEGELAVIIGKTGIDISEAEAMNYVYGFTILNDITARDLQRNHEQWFLGKSLQTFCPMGPYLLLRDAAPSSFTITTEVNGQLRQDASTAECIFSIAHLIHTLSQGMPLMAGDVLATGTPSGVGMGFNPPRYLKTHDTVSVNISAIGTLTNTIE